MVGREERRDWREYTESRRVRDPKENRGRVLEESLPREEEEKLLCSREQSQANDE